MHSQMDTLAAPWVLRKSLKGSSREVSEHMYVARPPHVDSLATSSRYRGVYFAPGITNNSIFQVREAALLWTDVFVARKIFDINYKQ